MFLAMPTDLKEQLKVYQAMDDLGQSAAGKVLLDVLGKSVNGALSMFLHGPDDLGTAMKMKGGMIAMAELIKEIEKGHENHGKVYEAMKKEREHNGQGR